MEKLQAALQKARKQRALTDNDTAPDAPTRKKASPAAPARPAPCDTLWADLKPFEIDAKQLDRYHLVSSTPTSASAHFDILRTKVLLEMKRNNWKRLAITSPMPSAGKTTTSCNLAMALGRQSELRTILMDTDLRAPSMREFFQTKPDQGIADVLKGKVDFADQAMRWGDNVACSMAAHAWPDPARILLAEETAEVLDQIESRFQPDLMIFDLPSVLVNDDTLAFLNNVDCALIVIRANETRYTQFDACEREVAQHTNVLGVVLNAYMNSSAGAH